MVWYLYYIIYNFLCQWWHILVFFFVFFDLPHSFLLVQFYLVHVDIWKRCCHGISHVWWRDFVSDNIESATRYFCFQICLVDYSKRFLGSLCAIFAYYFFYWLNYIFGPKYLDCAILVTWVSIVSTGSPKYFNCYNQVFWTTYWDQIVTIGKHGYQNFTIIILEAESAIKSFFILGSICIVSNSVLFLFQAVIPLTKYPFLS